MDPSLSEDEAFIAATKAELRTMGWFVRYTEWPLGHQVTVHAQSDTSRHLVTAWHATERAAWEEALRLVIEAAPRPHDEPWEPSAPLA